MVQENKTYLAKVTYRGIANVNVLSGRIMLDERYITPTPKTNMPGFFMLFDLEEEDLVNYIKIDNIIGFSISYK